MILALRQIKRSPLIVREKLIVQERLLQPPDLEVSDQQLPELERSPLVRLPPLIREPALETVTDQGILLPHLLQQRRTLRPM